jgi:hypothetical protein
MKTALLLTAAYSLPTQHDFEFLTYVSKWGKSYASLAEYNTRQAQYLETDKLIKAINSEKVTHVAGHNRFSDWTDQERKALLNYIDAAPEIETAEVQADN